MSRDAILDMSDDMMDRLFGDDRRRSVSGLGDGLSLAAAAAMMFGASPPIGSRAPLPRKAKVSPAKLAKRKQQSAQKRARKIERKFRP